MSKRVNILTTEINVTPFLDILLVLLVTFLASMNARKTMDAQLPVPCAGVCAAQGSPVVLEVMNDSTFQLNRQPVPAAQLLSTLRSAYAGRPDKVIHVAGHGAARYQAVLSAMDVARSAGVLVISIPPRDTYQAGFRAEDLKDSKRSVVDANH